MTSIERSTFPGSYFSYIAAAMEKALSCLNANYKKLSVTSIVSQIHSIFHRISRKSKNRDGPQNELPKDGGYSQESGLIDRRDVVRDSTIDPYPSITQEHNVENISLETLPSLYPRKNIYDKAGENSSSIEVSLGKKAETSIQLKGVSITRKEK